VGKRANFKKIHQSTTPLIQWGCVAVTSNSDKQTEFLISLSPISAVCFLMTTFLKSNAL
jgi:hypothetical protein